MSDINSVVLAGRLTADAILKYTQNGTAVTNFSIAVNRAVKKDDGYEKEVSFFNVNLWGKQAEALQQYLVKGRPVVIAGSLKQERWTDNDGSNKSKIVVNATQVQLLFSSNGQQGSSNGTQQQQPQSKKRPAQPKRNTQARQQNYTVSQAAQDYGSDDDELDNIPF